MNRITTKEQYEEVSKECARLVKLFKPISGNVDHIHLAKQFGIAYNDERLMLMQKTTAQANSYRKKVFDRRKKIISQFNFLFKQTT